MAEPVVVGVDGSQPAERALVFAANEAALHGAQLLIVHCGDVLTGQARARGEVRDYSHEVLRESVATAIDASDTCNIGTLLRDDQPAGVLLELSEHARMLVVGTHGVGRIAGALLGSVAHRVAAHARCPVVVVPEAWRARAEGEARPVAVGVSGSPSGRDALEFGFTEAERADLPLTAVRSCAEIDQAHSEDGAIRQQQQTLLTELVEAAWAKHPGVEVVTELASAPACDTLRVVAAHASLLVLGRRHTDDHDVARLGPVSSRVRSNSPCPVALVGRPVARATTSVAPDLALAGQS
jgi:nucleotide-binding universal stress UspA family protein